MAYDSILTLLGEFGPYNRRIFLLLSSIPIVIAFHSCVVVFNNVEPDFRCAVPDYNDSYVIEGDSHYQVVNSTVVYDEEENRFSHCSIYSSAIAGNRSIGDCKSWVYEPEQATWSIVAKYDLVCDREVFKAHASMFIMIGNLVGSILGGAIIDFFGAKKVVVTGVLIQAVVGVSAAFFNSIAMVFLARFVLAVLGVIIFIGDFVLLAEIVGPKWRMFASMGSMFGWCFGMMLLDLICYFIRDWQMAQIVMSLPAFLFLSYYWLLPDSPRWLLAHNRAAEAEVIIRKMAKVNKVKLPENITDLLIAETNSTQKDDTTQGPKNRIWQLFRSPTMVIRILILSFSWLTVNMVYYGLTLNVDSLVAGDIYVNFGLQGVMELIAYIMCVITMEKFSRKKMYCVFIILAGLACISTAGPIVTGSKINGVDVMLFSLGKLGVTGAFAVIFVVTSELFPTTFRNSGMGLCSFVGRIGAAISPYIGSLEIYLPGAFGKTLPLLIFGVCSIIAGVTALTLPETRNRKLPETIAQAEDQKNSRRISKKDGDIELTV